MAVAAILLGLTVFTSFVSSVSRLLGDIDGRKSRRRLQARARGARGTHMAAALAGSLNPAPPLTHTHTHAQQMELFLTHRGVPRPLVRRILDYHRQTAVRQLSPTELGVLQGAAAARRRR